MFLISIFCPPCCFLFPSIFPPCFSYLYYSALLDFLISINLPSLFSSLASLFYPTSFSCFNYSALYLVQDAWSHFLLIVLIICAADTIKHQVIELLFKCQLYCGACNVPHDHPTLFISTLVTLRYIPWELVA